MTDKEIEDTKEFINTLINNFEYEEDIIEWYAYNSLSRFTKISLVKHAFQEELDFLEYEEEFELCASLRDLIRVCDMMLVEESNKNGGDIILRDLDE